jgi:radical SAM superfamily enzyme
MLATADACAALGLDAVKIHNLHVVRDTPLEEMYRNGQVKLFERDEYVSLLCDFLERLPTTMVIHRLSGDAPPDYLVAPSWCAQKGPLLEAIDREFGRRGTRQGSQLSVSSTPRPSRVPLQISSH